MLYQRCSFSCVLAKDVGFQGREMSVCCEKNLGGREGGLNSQMSVGSHVVHMYDSMSSDTWIA